MTAGVPCICPTCNGRQYVLTRDDGVLTRLACWMCDGKGEIAWPTAEDNEGAEQPEPEGQEDERQERPDQPRAGGDRPS